MKKKIPQVMVCLAVALCMLLFTCFAGSVRATEYDKTLKQDQTEESVLEQGNEPSAPDGYVVATQHNRSILILDDQSSSQLSPSCSFQSVCSTDTVCMESHPMALCFCWAVWSAGCFPESV